MEHGVELVKQILFWIMKVIHNSFQIQNEHFVPKKAMDMDSYIRQKNVTAVHHLVRYYWAARIIEDLPEVKTILDIACGDGYGSHLVSEKFPTAEIFGVDIDKSAIEKATRTYYNKNLNYSTGDVLEWDKTIGDRKFDIILSFDTLEHVSHREIMLENIIRHLAPQGKLLLSTPCGRAENVFFPSWNAHRIEFSYISLYDLMKRYFRVVRKPDDNEFPHLEIFNEIILRGIYYNTQMNPIICEGPIYITNPYYDLADI